MAGFRRSEQEQRVMDEYGVTTRDALRRAVRDEYARETGEPYSLRDADLMLDGMFEAKYQQIAGGAFDRSPDDLPLTKSEWNAMGRRDAEFDADAAYERHLENLGEIE